MCGQTSCCVTVQLLTLKEQVKELTTQVAEGKRWEGLYRAEARTCEYWRKSAHNSQDRATEEKNRRVKAVAALKTLITELKEQPNVN